MATYSPFYTVNSDLGNLGNFGSLVRFIDDWDKHINKPQNARSGQQQRHPARRNVLPTFTPRFDVKETEQNFELYGELPGVDKSNIQIEFTEPQTMVIKGTVERTYTAGTPPAGLLEDTSMSGAITHETHNDDAQDQTGSTFQPTVEDEKEGGDENASGSKAQSKSDSSKAQEPKAKFWVYERNVGSFQRTFTFSSRVDQDNVQASLENGILHVVVPKAKKPESRRIAIR
jgi:HSP20 family molecular chaperone IbpA